MYELSENDRLLCRFVSDLFEYSTTQKDCSSKLFIKAYAFSTLEKTRLSSDTFLFDCISVPEAYEIIKKEKKLERGKEIYPSYVMAWIGYIMEFFCVTQKLPISIFYRLIKPDELYSIYEAYHSMDNELALRRIMEAKGMRTIENRNDVELMTRIYFGKSKIKNTYKN